MGVIAGQAQLQDRLHTAIVESDTADAVVANKVANTVGMYGQIETAIDLEKTRSPRRSSSVATSWKPSLSRFSMG